MIIVNGLTKSEISNMTAVYETGQFAQEQVFSSRRSCILCVDDKQRLNGKTFAFFTFLFWLENKL